MIKSSMKQILELSRNAKTQCRFEKKNAKRHSDKSLSMKVTNKYEREQRRDDIYKKNISCQAELNTQEQKDYRRLEELSYFGHSLSSASVSVPPRPSVNACTDPKTAPAPKWNQMPKSNGKMRFMIIMQKCDVKSRTTNS